MEKLIGICVFVLFCLVGYAGEAFYYQSFHPEVWGQGGRACYLVYVACVLFVVFGILSDIGSQHEVGGYGID